MSLLVAAVLTAPGAPTAAWLFPAVPRRGGHACRGVPLPSLAGALGAFLVAVGGTLTTVVLLAFGRVPGNEGVGVAVSAGVAVPAGVSARSPRRGVEQSASDAAAAPARPGNRRLSTGGSIGASCGGRGGRSGYSRPDTGRPRGRRVWLVTS